MGCPAKITIVYDRITKVLVVRECNLEHNHLVGSKIMLHYPSSRRLSKEQQQEMHTLLKLRPSNKHLKEHILKQFGTFTTLKDIQNMKTKVREMEKQGRTDAQRTIDELAEALQRDRNAKGGVAIVGLEAGHKVKGLWLCMKCDES